MLLAAQILSQKFNTSNSPSNFLNLTVNAGLNLVANPIKKLRKIIKTIRKSTKYLEALNRLALANNQPSYYPILDVKTRWNLTFHMLQCALLLKEQLETLCSQRNTSLYDNWPNETEWNIIAVSYNLI